MEHRTETRSKFTADAAYSRPSGHDISSTRRAGPDESDQQIGQQDRVDGVLIEYVTQRAKPRGAGVAPR